MLKRQLPNPDGPSKRVTATLWAVRLGGLSFALVATALLFFGLGGHTHGSLRVSGADGAVLVPSSRDTSAAPAQLTAGQLNFEIDGAGSETHELVILERNATGRAVNRLVVGNGSAANTIFLAPGKYQVVCVTDGHAAQGMTYEISVK